MRKTSFLAVILLALLVLGYVLIGPHFPSIDHQELNCKRYMKTLETIRRATGAVADGRLKVQDGLEVAGFVDEWGNKILYEKGVLYSKGDMALPFHTIGANNNLRIYYCGKI